MVDIETIRTIVMIVANFVAVLSGVVIGLSHDRKLQEERRKQEMKRKQDDLDAIIDQLTRELQNLKSTASDIQNSIEGKEGRPSHVRFENSIWNAYQEQFIRLWKLDDAAGDRKSSEMSLPVRLTGLYSRVEETNRILDTILESGYTKLPMRARNPDDEIEVNRIDRHRTMLLKRSNQIEEEADLIVEALPKRGE